MAVAEAQRAGPARGSGRTERWTLDLGRVQAWPGEERREGDRETFARRAHALWRSIWSAPDRRSREVGLGGELLVARFRLLLSSLLLAGVAARCLHDPRELEAWLGLLVTGVATAAAWAIAAAARRPPVPIWLPFATSMADVAFVTSTSALVIAFGDPRAAASSLVLYALYYLAIAASTLRSDARLCIATGAAAILQYGIVVGVCLHLAPPADFPVRSGWAIQVDRSLLLAMATVLSTAAVLRSRQLLHRSTRDALTGLYNRGFFEVLLEREVAQARRHGEPFALALVDVDHFKRFNDTFGHLSGDGALRRMGRLLGGSFRESDVVARFGGEEFAVLLPRTDLAAAWARLEKVRLRVEGAAFEANGSGAPERLTVSIGVALWPRDGLEGEAVVEVADRRLYAAKHAGRNRVMSSNWRPLDLEPLPMWRGTRDAGAGPTPLAPAGTPPPPAPAAESACAGT